MKNLSINLPYPNPSSQSLNSAIEPPPSAIDPNPPLRPRRPSVLSLPNPSLSSAIHRQDEDGSPSIPYTTGPVQILPGIWLGSEDNARDWPSLRDRGISAILNVAKEVVSPFDYAHPQPLRPFASAPVSVSHPRPSTSTYYPPHPPSGRPPMHYLKLNWSHGQRDLVTDGFPTAMAFVDAALQRNQGILIHCQCGVSRSATLLIALVMRAAATRSPNVPSDVWDLKGMQAAYSFVKDKSRHVGPNMSLIYQLLDYEKALQGGRASPVLSDHASSSNEEDKEWGRRRNAFAQEEGEIDAVQQEAKALDRAMEERIIARKPSSSSLNSGMGMGSAWRSRYGRKRTGSNPELLGVGGAFDDALELRRSPSLSSESPGSPSETNAQTPHALKAHSAGSYAPLSAPPSAPVTKLFFNVPRPPTNLNFKIAPGKGKRRPAPLGTLPPVPPSPVTPIAVQESKLSPRRRKHLSGKQAPPPLKLQGESSSIAFPTNTPPSKYPVSALPSQTLFVFPPSPTVTAATAMRTPATMTITSNVDNNTYPFPSQTTPRVATSRSHGRTRSFIGLGTSAAPTTAYSRVDARGWVGLE
ncbi:phosphatases II [Butyriboletus roseoflavus]|nr:phosphatases II [Butyriboletus roseoflavus]